MNNNNIVELNEKNFNDEVLKSDKAVVVKFYLKDGCRFCDIMQHVFNSYASNNPEIKCCKYEIGKEKDSITGKYNVTNVPAFMAFVDGEPIKELVPKKLTGVITTKEIGEILKTNIPLGK